MEQQESLYDRFGGHEKVGEMVGDFYKSVLEDASLAKFFHEVDIETQKSHQTHFLSAAMGGPNHYSGRALSEAHDGINTTGEHFDSFVKHLRHTMENHDMGQAEMDIVVESILAYKQDVVKGELS
ncbi:group 1 truncated hemoglobin [Bacillus sp. DNRA2]|uniref:group I truncated hemoglobin n=1 Tax=Bacillus sp. DNRA2 TaxID=2723053 RepID=UPI00145C86B0|nr:group 1 truncated hemoglobin [Bacillus sp. DNRA2]NMD69205.1 group 1 truncated hemoglobin [Bacillus sp. DNRA2]